MSKPRARTKIYEHTDIFKRRGQPAYTTVVSCPINQSQKGITDYLSLSTYRTNPIVTLLQYDSLVSASAA